MIYERLKFTEREVRRQIAGLTEGNLYTLRSEASWVLDRRVLQFCDERLAEITAAQEARAQRTQRRRDNQRQRMLRDQERSSQGLITASVMVQEHTRETPSGDTLVQEHQRTYWVRPE